MANLLGIASALLKTRRGEADVTGELRGAGLAFGDLVLRTGQAVANTQRQLNQTSSATATALATTKVDVIAVQEKIFDDQGTLTSVQTHTRKLPLINFIDPVFYEWTSVRLIGTFTANEFVSESSSSSSGVAGGSVSPGGGPTLFGIRLGGAKSSFSGAVGGSSSASASTATDLAVGQVRMNALLRPRRDVGVPKPNQAIQGPRLAIIEGAITNLPGPPATRTASVTIEYHRIDGTPIAGKSISIDTHGIPWQFAGATQTDANGQVAIELVRQFLDPQADTGPVDVIVEARIGLVAASTTVTF